MSNAGATREVATVRASLDLDFWSILASHSTAAQR